MKTTLLAGMTLATLSCGAAAAVQVAIDSIKPTQSIVSSYEASGSVGQYGPFNSPGDGRREVSIQFRVANDAPAYLLEEVTMRLHTVSGAYAAPAPFTLEFSRLSAPGSPAGGTLLPGGTQTGSFTLDSSTHPSGSYITFTLETPLLLEGGGLYAYRFAFDTTASYHYLRLEIGTPSGSSGAGWVSSNGGAWVNAGVNYTHFITASAVPEPGALALAGVGLVFAFGTVRRRWNFFA